MQHKCNNNTANLNIRNDVGRTAMMIAAYLGHGDIVKYLHRAGADINIRDNDL